MSPLSLTENDRQAAWRLLLQTYGAARSVSEQGLALCRRQFHDQADRDPGLAAVLGRELLGRKLFDAAARDVYLVLGESSPREQRITWRRAAVRCDLRLREFVPGRLEWYREALAEGSVSAAFVLTLAALSDRLDDAELGAEAVCRALQEGGEREWRGVGLQVAAGRRWLARHHLQRPVSPAGVDVVAQVVAAEPDHVEGLQYLARAWRPDAAPEHVAVYEALFRAAPDDRENTGFLAGELLAGRIALSDPCAVLAAWLALEPPDGAAARLGLAHAAVAAGRHDAEAAEWIRQAAELPGAPAELCAWLAVCEVRAGRADLDRHRPVVLDAALPAEWRAEIGLSLSRIVEQAGGRDAELFEGTWAALAVGTRPDWLALSLAAVYAAAGRLDAGTTAVYGHAFQADPSAEHARLLGHTYLVDEGVPVRQKIAHWRACLDRGRADPEMLTELAKAYAAEGAATEAALNVVENMPAAQQPRVLDELCRYRFRRGDYRSAETIAAALVQLRPDDPDALWKLLLCRVRNALVADQRLDRVDLSAAAAWPEHAGLRALGVLVAAATGQPVDDSALADALHTGVTATPALLAARAVLAGQPGSVPDDAETPEEALLLAAVAHAQHGAEAARRRLQDARDPDLRLFERALAAQQAAQAGRPEQAWQFLTPAAHRQGPPWDSYRPMLLHLALKAAPAAALDSLYALFDARQGFAAALRRVDALAQEHDPAALDRLYDMDAQVDLPVWRAMHVALICRTVQDELIAGAVERADLRLAVLREVEPVPEAVTWLSAVVADRRGDLDAALAHAYHLPAEVRARPGVAWVLASWFMRNQQVRMAEAALRHALAAHEDRALRFAVTALNGQLGRGDEFVHIATPLLEELPDQDPRRDVLELLCDAYSANLADADTAALTSGLERLSAAQVTVRLRVILAAVAAQIQAGRAASARSVVATRLGELRRIRLPRAAQAWVAELQNLLAYAHLLVVDHDQAREALRALSPRPAAAIHNLAVIAEAQQDFPAAARRHEQAIEAWAEAPFEKVSSTYREAVMFAAHSHVAGLYRALEQWADELRHLDACIATRPFDIHTQRASIQPLIALGEVERALHKSGWLITERPDELDVQLDHATVLASARGAGAAIAHLDELSTKRTDALDAIRQRKAELRERLGEVAAERAGSGDWRATFSAARDVEALAETEEQQLEALRQQAEALLHMAEAGEAVSLLEQGLAKCREAQALHPTGATAAAFAALEKQLGAALAPLLAHSADELFRHRRKAYYTLTEQEQTGAPADAAEQARQLGEAFTRVAGLFERASELGGSRLASQVRARLAESRELVTKCRELGQRLGRRR